MTDKQIFFHSHVHEYCLHPDQTELDVYPHFTEIKIVPMQKPCPALTALDSRSAAEYTLMYFLGCVPPGALTQLDILKIRQSISSSSQHLKGNECHLIEIGSLSWQRRNIISDVCLLFGAAFSSPTFRKHTPASYYLKISESRRRFDVPDPQTGAEINLNSSIVWSNWHMHTFGLHSCKG